MDTLDQKVNKEELESRVKQMYTEVARQPKAEYHFEMGRGLAEKLGYPKADLDAIPATAIDSFAGVGYHFGLAGMREGEQVLDLGSGSGTDLFIAALKSGKSGQVVGVDMTAAQLDRRKISKAGVDLRMFLSSKAILKSFPSKMRVLISLSQME